MKKICFVTTISATLSSFVVETAKCIHNNTDWDITFICNYDEKFEKTLPEYIHYIPVPMERGISIAGVKAMLEMKKIFQREKFDLIQYSTPNASLYASMAGKLAHVPVRLYCQWGLVFVGFQGLKRKIFQMEEKYVCHLSTHIEPDSNSNLRFAHEIGLYPKSKGSVIWNGSACGVNLTKFDISNKEEYRKDIREQLDIPEDAFVYGFVGRITRDKGINELLEAYKKLNDDSYLIMVGRSEVDETINQELYTWASKNEKIKFTGYTTVVEQYLSAMDCYILPSYREGFGMGVVEAEAMGVPVIVTDIPGPIDAMIDNETGIVVQKADVESLYNAMISIREDKVRYFVMAEKAHDFAVNNFEQKQLFSYILEDRKKLLGE
ncbi:glycosyltransferase [uncultured Eubacterium sp.]|uniref:glycosyltransferase n=1 Tax=uncultured Eubacterium sp. TaxID=165185 RepID=UPI0025DBC09A|nr:glycosyltransferase [uncultured Eubacterium sp.]